ncbi:hypothetical protein SEPCBS57363_002683 [Sporothrix epigloea]|uniref:Uncharacterized protein n=1 Tax=Sporothrix epigloea TaxID=1892477 RepID=A0ABP0DJ00_9PEZI
MSITSEPADAKITELARQLERRDADVQQLQAANASLTAQLTSIPERNFQALSTCVKKILEKLDAARSEILTGGKSTDQQHQEQ